MTQKLFIALLALFIFPVIAFADNYDDGRAAANRGEFATAYSLWKPLADNGDERALFSMGRMYARGDGVHKDFDTARKYFEQSAGREYGPALLALGKMYHFGDGVPQDEERADDYFGRAADKGITEANAFLKPGRAPKVYNMDAQHTAPDVIEPAEIPNSASSTAPEFPTPIATSSSYGGVDAAATPGDTNAPINDLSPALPTPDVGPTNAPAVVPDAGIADPLAPYHGRDGSNSASVGADGRSIRFDPVAEAIIHGLPGGGVALTTYQNSLFYGPLVTDDKSLANYLAEANGGNPDSQNVMGFAALNAGNLELAQNWFDRSAKQGNGVAIFAMGNFAFDNNYAHAGQLFEQASTAGIVAAKRNLGYFLLKGIGLDQNAERGKTLLLQASQQGDALAADLLK